MKPAYRVLVIESERGWGQKVEEDRRFRGENAKQDAEKFVKEHNAQNNKLVVPDIYWYAMDPEFIDEDDPRYAEKKV